MTATPLREDNRDTYRYFGNPIYQYSLRQGIEDGFLAPYRVHRVALRTRRERADRLRKEQKDFFDQYGPKAREILNELLEKYAEHGTAQFVIPDVLKVPPISSHGNAMEIAGFFGGPERLRQAVNQLQTLLYAA